MSQIIAFRAKKLAALETMKKALSQLSLNDAMEVTGQLLSDLSSANPKQAKSDIKPSASVLQPRKRGGVSAIDKDPELETFILSLKGPRTIANIRTACAKKFGDKRAPSKSALHRYIQKLQYRHDEEL
tara:strand:- start:243 stop:626 length:384 start_codon:yes stop_codon:yes gene_type:complete